MRNRAASLVLTAVLLAQASASTPPAPGPPRSNVFGDPFLQVTAGLPSCPTPEPPGVTADEAAALAHDRAQRGVSCWLDGRCRLPNAYLYDAEITPRAQQALRLDGRFGDTSLWVGSQRRWVRLQGCVSTVAQAAEAERVLRRIDDVEGVHIELMVGVDGRPAYRALPR